MYIDMRCALIIITKPFIPYDDRSFIFTTVHYGPPPVWQMMPWAQVHNIQYSMEDQSVQWMQWTIRVSLWPLIPLVKTLQGDYDECIRIKFNVHDPLLPWGDGK